MSASHWKPTFSPVQTLELPIKAIEEMTSEELTREEIEELRQVFDDKQNDSPQSQH